MSKDDINPDFEKASSILNQAIAGFDQVINLITIDQQEVFRDNPMLITTLPITAMCCYINKYVANFPESLQPILNTLIVQNLGLTSLPNLTYDLASMPVVGCA